MSSECDIFVRHVQRHAQQGRSFNANTEANGMPADAILFLVFIKQQHRTI
jgi:hypothetical protein